MGEDELEEEAVDEGDPERSFEAELVVESNAPSGLACSVSSAELRRERKVAGSELVRCSGEPNSPSFC